MGQEREGREGWHKVRKRGEQRGGEDRQKERQSGSGPGLSLAKIEPFASCQFETAALSQKDAALRGFCWLMCLSVFACLCAHAWVLQSSESSADVLKHRTGIICITSWTDRKDSLYKTQTCPAAVAPPLPSRRDCPLLPSCLPPQPWRRWEAA